MKRLLVALLFAAAPLLAQQEEPAIQDNSLLTEEAYNQEAGVVQHISFFQRDRRTHDWLYTFSQEWPAPNIRHQLSYTLPLQRLGGEAAKLGDVELNYRYQLLGDGDAKLAIAPRITIALPTGDRKHGAGTGAVGYDAALAVSYVPRPAWNVHVNAGVNATPHARDAAGTRADLRGFELAGNVVWLPAKRFNVMVETVFDRQRDFDGWSNDVVVSPAIRWAYNRPGGLQIVPAIGAPIGIGPSAGERSVILYLSFER